MSEFKILLVADVPNWAFDRDAKAIAKYLPQYKIDITYNKKFNNILFSKYDHVHFMNWLGGVRFSKRISAGVSSHNFELLHKEESERVFPSYMALLATSKIIFEKIKNKNEKVFYAPGGVHEDLFFPNYSDHKGFVVGWVGQKTNGKIDIKGFNTILSPLIKSLSKYKDIRFKILTNNYKNAISYKEMPKFYCDVDVQICTSLAEGSPNPMFEAASCGKALISTNVGAISEAIKENYNGYIIPEYNKKEDFNFVIEKFKEKILFLRNNKEVCLNMGINSRKVIERSWCWKDTVKRWIPLFEYARSISLQE